MSFIPIAEYRPDIALLNGAYSDEIRNVLPADGSYIPMPSFKPLSQKLPSMPLGSFAVRSADGGTSIFAGTADRLYRLNNTDFSWEDITPDNITYSANIQARWSFAVFGNYVLAVNKNNAPQVFELGKANKFRPLGGNPPRAGLVKIWGDFVCLMQLPDNPNRVFWSGLNDAECWTEGENNCDYQDFADGGFVQGSTETTNPIIFLQSGIYAGSFIPGSDIVFSFRKLHDKRGAVSAQSIACRGTQAFYADQGGFFQIGAEGEIVSIGFEKVDRTVFSRLNAVNISEIYGVIDPFYARIYWAMDYEGRGHFDEMLVYDWGLQRWSLITISALAILPIYPAGYSLEGLDKVAAELGNLPFSLDSKAWQGSAPILGIFSDDYRLGAFSGPPMEALVASQELGSPSGAMQRITALYPQIDSNAAQLELGTRFLSAETMRWAPPLAASYYTGRYHMRSRARFHKFRLRVPEGEIWHHINGFDAEMSQAGRR
ncbi:MAG: hypothetical protein DU429_05165 [Candidatus Tokpelaia sp.]|uniref:hypothetical protein n=1 Tax=Candidatus Tokpelaia sp. TaxID=2233777 RepID=UPI00123A9545|nr:hypothetical protein [Candidatus Tokpelaia sp.]KAA6204561.1 MAG: hypothetical protein DU430_07885 [Candidatus Tokpelaia sp.]KAA6206852.1 MAG: hypothetical protein DU429_05165 [Candidatus Tokpelaia sp.]KAA6404612.1 hypothetical protein DPQ22_09025 [Candidatus Tokpelaia sp.]